MRIVWVLVFFCPLLQSGQAGAETLERVPLVVRIGEQRLLRVPGLVRYALGSPVVRVHPLGENLTGSEARESLLIRAVEPGAGDLWIWKTDGSSEHRSIEVEKSSESSMPAGLSRALSRLESCEVILAGPGVILRGQLEDEAEAGRVWAVVHAFPKAVLDETDLSDALLARAKIRLEAATQHLAQLASLRVEQIGQTLWVRGSVHKVEDLPSIERRIRSAFSAVELELDALPDSAPTVHFKVFLLELKKSRIGSFGLSWPALQEGAFRVTTSGIQDMLQLDLTLQELEGEGAVHVLSNPELVVRAPGEAQLFAGGEIPISVREHYYQNTTWKAYGLTLKLKVAATTSEKVRLEVFTEVSRLDPSITLDQVPALQTNRMNTSVDARYGIPLFLSGLLQQGTRENARGLPLLRQIPVLGALFGSEDYLNERSELVAVLLPGLEPPPPPVGRFEVERKRMREIFGEAPGSGFGAEPATVASPAPAPAEIETNFRRRVEWGLLR